MAETQSSVETKPTIAPPARRAASKSTAAKPATKASSKPATKATKPKTATPKPATPKSAAPKAAVAKSASATPSVSDTPAKAAPAARAKPKASAKATPAARAKTGNGAAKSADTSKSAKEHTEHVERIWELAKRIGICMFVTWDGDRQRARPLAAHVEKDEQAIYFLTDVSGEKDDQVENFPVVTLAFADHAHSKYVSITGTATVSNDRARIKDLWSPFAKAWWDSPEDPSIRVVKVSPQDAELWDSPGRIVSTISMLAAAVTRRAPKIGENAKVAF